MGCITTYTASWQHSSDIIAKQYDCFDLQLFNSEKTEEATPKRRAEARNKGQVAKSAEINSAFIILSAFCTLKVVAPYIYDEFSGLFRLLYGQFSTGDFTINFIHELFLTLCIIFLKTALPVMLSILVVSFFINVMQVGFNFTLEPLMPNFDRINPLSGFGRLFSKRSLVELIKCFLKIFIVGYFIYRFLSKEISSVPRFMTTDPVDSLQTVAALTFDLALQIGVVMLVLAGLDYFYQLWDHNQSLKMSKEDVKQEFKQTEGNPQIKGKIKERQRAMAMQRMMQEVPKANVIVTNPTHFAVALKYEAGMPAPTVIAKGQDLIAKRIKELALEHRIAIVENKPLARSLYAAVDIGEQVPPDLYQAVAEVLAYVFRLKKRLS